MQIPNRVRRAAGRIERRPATVEYHPAIRDLTARYQFAMDYRDLASTCLLFTENASFGSVDGAMRATGIADDATAMDRLERNLACDVPNAADCPGRVPTCVAMRPGKLKP